MLSRVAESVYWISRYLERASNIARFIEAHFELSLDLPGDEIQAWAPLLEVTGDRALFTAGYGDRATQDNVIRFLTFDSRSPNSILSCLVKARENARTVREILPADLWEEINSFYHFVMNAASNSSDRLANPGTFFRQVKRSGITVGGIARESMAQGEIRQFFQAGRMLERADKTSRMLDVKYFVLLPGVEYVGTPYDDIHWAALLRSLSGFEVYRRLYGRIQPQSVAQFLILDATFPRSIRYCVNRADRCFRALSGTGPGYYANPVEQHLGKLCADLSYMEVSTIISEGLHEFVDHLQRRMNHVDSSVFETFFSLHPVTT